jgi:TM2 domain-containing membrane protein YozV
MWGVNLGDSSFCNECGAEILKDAKFCQECGNEIKESKNIEPDSKSNQKTDKKNPVEAALLNIIIAGLGFIYIGEYAKGLISFIAVFAVGYFLGLIWGIIALIVVILWTYDEAKKIIRT